MIKLFGGGPGFGLPEISPYVTKTEIQLKMLGLAYEKERARPNQSPKGQVPFVDDDGTVVADSTFIRLYLEKKTGKDLDAGLDETQRAQAWAIERMIENQFGWVCTYSRWLIPENFEKGPAHWFDEAPPEIREKLRADIQERVRTNVLAVGIGRHTPAEIVELGARSLKALSAILGDKPYLMGNDPTSVDAIAFGALAGILTEFFDSPLRRGAESFPNLVAYVGRVMRRFYPEHAWNRALRRAAQGTESAADAPAAA